MPLASPRPTGGRRKKLKPSERAALPETVVARPDGLTAAEAAHWDRLAPVAHRMRTLLPETVPGFTVLCQVLADRDAARAVLARDGLMTPDGSQAHPLTTHVRQLTQRAESLLAKFLLVALAREVQVPKDPETFFNPWARREQDITGHEDFYGIGPREVK